MVLVLCIHTDNAFHGDSTLKVNKISSSSLKCNKQLSRLYLFIYWFSRFPSLIGGFQKIGSLLDGITPLLHPHLLQSPSLLNFEGFPSIFIAFFYSSPFFIHFLNFHAVLFSILVSFHWCLLNLCPFTLFDL